MAQIIANATNKGGEGKTTLSILLTDYCGLILGKKVLGIDLDPQANYSKYYLDIDYDPAYKEGKQPPLHPDYNPEEDTDWDGRSSIADIFFVDPVMPYPTQFDNIEILPAHSRKLVEAKMVTRSEVLEKVHLQLKRFVQLPEVQEEYDVIVIDTPPDKEALTICGIKACTHMVIPSQMEEDSIDGIYGMLQLWKQETYQRPPNDSISLAGIVANRVNNTTKDTSFYDQLATAEATKNFLLPHKIKQRVVHGELRIKTDRPKSIFDLPKTNPARQECIAVCEELTKRIFNHG